MNFKQSSTIKQIFRRTNSIGDKVTRVKIERLENGSIMMSVWHSFCNRWFGQHFTLYIIGKQGAIRRETKAY